VSPEEIKQLRKDLNLSARELATSIKAETEDVWAWETGERFPTKRFVTRMLVLRKAGTPKRAPVDAPEPKPKAPAKPATTATTPASGPVSLARLADPELWTVVRKLVEHPALFESVVALAKGYPDPAVPAPVAPKSDA
jgi:hypothetical protein